MRLECRNYSSMPNMNNSMCRDNSVHYLPHVWIRICALREWSHLLLEFTVQNNDQTTAPITEWIIISISSSSPTDCDFRSIERTSYQLEFGAIKICVWLERRSYWVLQCNDKMGDKNKTYLNEAADWRLGEECGMINVSATIWPCARASTWTWIIHMQINRLETDAADWAAWIILNLFRRRNEINIAGSFARNASRSTVRFPTTQMNEFRLFFRHFLFSFPNCCGGRLVSVYTKHFTLLNDNNWLFKGRWNSGTVERMA